MRQLEMFAKKKASLPKSKTSSTHKQKPIPKMIALCDLAKIRGDITALITENGATWLVGAEAAPNLLAIDPGSQTGWASITDNKLTVGMLPNDSDFGAMWCEELVRIINHQKPQIVICEGAFLNNDPRKRNPVSFASLNRRVGAILQACSATAPVWIVQAAQWQHAFFKRTDRETGKLISRRVCAERTGYEPQTDHESDAVLMALWARGPLNQTITKRS